MAQLGLSGWSEDEGNEDAEDMTIVSTMQRETRLGDSTGRFYALTSTIYGSSKRSLDRKDKCNYVHVSVPHVALGVNFIWQPSLGKMVAMISISLLSGVLTCSQSHMETA